MKIDTTNLTRKSLFVLSYNVFGGLIGYITMFFVYRFVGQLSWGIFGSALAIGGITSVILDLGINTTHVRKITELTEQKNYDEYMSTYVLLKFILAVIYLVLMYGGIFILKYFFHIGFETHYLQMAVYVALAAYFLGAFTHIFKTTYQAHIHTKKAISPVFLKTTVQNLAIIAFSIWWYTFSPDVPVEFMGVLFTYSFLLGTAAQLFAYVRISGDISFKFKIPSSRTIKAYILLALPLSFVGMVNTIQLFTDRIMLQFFWSAYEVGGYFGVQKIAMFLNYIANSVTFVIFPALATHYSMKRHTEFKDIAYKAERYISLISVFFVSFIIALSPQILNLWNKNLLNYWLVLDILLIYEFLFAINVPYRSQLISGNLVSVLLRITTLQAILNVALDLVLIPTSIFGIPLMGLKSEGAALGSLISFTVGFLYVRYISYKHFKMIVSKSLIKHILVGALIFIMIYAVNMYIYPINRVYDIALSFFVFGAVYIGLLMAVREITRSEITEIIRKVFRTK